MALLSPAPAFGPPAPGRLVGHSIKPAAMAAFESASLAGLTRGKISVTNWGFFAPLYVAPI